MFLRDLPCNVTCGLHHAESVWKNLEILISSLEEGSIFMISFVIPSVSGRRDEAVHKLKCRLCILRAVICNLFFHPFSFSPFQASSALFVGVLRYCPECFMLLFCTCSTLSKLTDGKRVRCFGLFL